MSLFEDMILNEARAIHPQPMVKDKDDATPSVTTAIIFPFRALIS